MCPGNNEAQAPHANAAPRVDPEVKRERRSKSKRKAPRRRPHALVREHPPQRSLLHAHGAQYGKVVRAQQHARGGGVKGARQADRCCDDANAREQNLQRRVVHLSLMRLSPLVHGTVQGSERRVLLEQKLDLLRGARRVLGRGIERDHAVPNELLVKIRNGRRRREHRGKHALKLAACEPEPRRYPVEKPHDLPRHACPDDREPRPEKRLGKRTLPRAVRVGHPVHDDAAVRVHRSAHLVAQTRPCGVVDVEDRAEDVAIGTPELLVRPRRHRTVIQVQRDLRLGDKARLVNAVLCPQPLEQRRQIGQLAPGPQRSRSSLGAHAGAHVCVRPLEDGLSLIDRQDATAHQERHGERECSDR